MRQAVRVWLLILLGLVVLIAVADVAAQDFSSTPIGLHFFRWTWNQPIATIVIAVFVLGVLFGLVSRLLWDITRILPGPRHPEEAVQPASPSGAPPQSGPA